MRFLERCPREGELRNDPHGTAPILLKKDPAIFSAEQLRVVVHPGMDLVGPRWAVVAASIEVALLDDGRQFWHAQSFGMLAEDHFHRAMESQMSADRAGDRTLLLRKPNTSVVYLSLKDLAAILELG
jgi:hypothetical protein